MAYRKPYYDENHKLVRYGPVSFLRDAWNFCRNFFAFRNVKHAFRGVTTGFREYFVFFVSIFLLQTLFFTVWLRFDTASAVAREEAYSGDGYNLTVEKISQEAYTELFNSYLSFAEENSPADRGYEVLDTEGYYDGYGDRYYRLNFILTDDSIEFCDAIVSRYGLGSEEFSVSYGERSNYLNRISEMKRKSVVTTVLVGALAAAALTLLFYIRINQNKFLYGIYIAFGAGFEKLLETAWWELLAVALMTYLPAAGASAGIYSAVAAAGGAKPVFVWGRLGWGLLWTTAVVALSVVPGVRIISKKMPVSLITAADNSNYVSSPRVSFRIFGKRFPFHYELFGFVRFRSYYIMLVSAAVAFTVVFSTGLFLADLKKTEAEDNRPYFTLSAGSGELDRYDIAGIDDIEGVDYTLWSKSADATSLRSFVLLTKEQSSGISSMTVKDPATGLYADNNARYSRLSELLAEEVTSHGVWKVDGDLAAVAAGGETVAVTRSINNRDVLGFKVGDRITVATFREQGRPLVFDRIDKKYVLSVLLNDAYFNYTEVTVGAVVDDGDTSDEYTVYMPDALYAKITGDGSGYTDASVYLERGIANSETGRIRSEIVKIMSVHRGYTVTPTGEGYRRALAQKAGARLPLITGSAAVLLISPLVWLYAQSAFCRKRYGEIFLLSACGAKDSDIRKLFLFSGAVLTVLAAAATAGIGSLLNYIIYYLVNVYFPSMGFGEQIRYDYTFSPLGFAVCVLLSAAAAMLSTYLPFIAFVRDRDRIARVENGE